MKHLFCRWCNGNCIKFSMIQTHILVMLCRILMILVNMNVYENSLYCDGIEDVQGMTAIIDGIKSEELSKPFCCQLLLNKLLEPL